MSPRYPLWCALLAGPDGWRRAVVACLIALSLAFATEAGAARGRPYINAAGTTFVTDSGSLIRGAIISTETGSIPSVADLQAIKSQGLNTVHCYAERSDYGYAAGAKFAAVDTVVARTRDAGLYLVLTVGGGGVNRAFNTAFWTFYAPRYANETHVLYEIQNEPGNGAPVSAANIEMQQANHAIIRAAAPDTPILFFSYMIFQNGAGVLTDIAALGTGVDWTKAAIAFHGYGENGPAGTRACLETVLNAGYACMQTEFYRWPWGTGNFALVDPPSLYTDVDETGDLERLGVSWLSFLTLKRVQDTTRFRDQLDRAGIGWVPDFGTWPVGPRATYGNSGEPWLVRMSAATRIQAEDFDTGGEGRAYHDSATLNSGASYRTGEGVDIQTTSDTGGGYNVGWIVAGEWMEYTVLVRDPGRYALRLRVASSSAEGAVRVTLGGEELVGAWTFAGTGAHQAWTTISRDVDLRPGQQLLRVEALVSGFNLNWIELSPATTGPLPDGIYEVFNRVGLRAMEVAGASNSNGAKIRQAEAYTGASHQRWRFTHKGAHQYTIVGVASGRALDTASNTLLSGDVLSMWPSKTTPGQRWLVQATDSGYYRMLGASSGLAIGLASAGGEAGSLVEHREYEGAAHRQWLLRADGPATFAAWLAVQYPSSADRANPLVGGAGADPRGTGLANLARYALGADAAADASLRRPRLSGGESGYVFSFPYDPARPDVVYRVESSVDLATWDASPLYDSSLDGAPALADGWASISVAAPAAGRRFYRLRIDLR